MFKWKDLVISILLIVCICCSIAAALKTGVTQGERGLTGQNGMDGSDGKDGLNGLDGKDGANGMDGSDGKDGLNGLDGKDGANGKDGESAYDIAVRNGFNGTEKEWLESLNGSKGDTPYIGANGNWFISDEDTGCKATVLGETVLLTDESVLRLRNYNIDDVVTFRIDHYSFYKLNQSEGNILWSDNIYDSKAGVYREALVYIDNKTAIDIHNTVITTDCPLHSGCYQTHDSIIVVGRIEDIYSVYDSNGVKCIRYQIIPYYMYY